MNSLNVFALVAILVQGALGAGFDLSSIMNWYQQNHGSHHSSGFFPHSGCDNRDERDHVIRLLTDWHYHHESDAFMKFYTDVALIDMEMSAGALPKDRRAGTHDEAYKNQNTVPNIAHLEHLVRADNMNAACRMDILNLIEKYEHISLPPTTTTTTPTTHAHHQHNHQQHHTHAPHTHAPHTHAPHTTHTPKPTQLAVTPKPTTKAPTTHAPATHAPTKATTTNAPVTTTTKPVVQQQASCDQLTLVTDLAKTAIITHPMAGFCGDGTRSQSESLILQACNVPAPNQWRQGKQVLGNCEQIPKFSPISTFLLGNYVMDGTSLSGVLLECLPNGFKMAAQICGHTPQIYNILTGSSDARQNAGSYYMIDS